MSDVVVVDASLALKWVLPEDDSDIANMRGGDNVGVELGQEAQYL